MVASSLALLCACGRSPTTQHAAEATPSNVAPSKGASPKTADSAKAPASTKPAASAKAAASAKPATATKPALGPLATEDFKLQRRCPLARREGSPIKSGYDVTLSMQWPATAPSEALLTTLRSSVTKLLTGQSVPKMPPKAVLEAAFLVHCAKYRAEHADELARVERDGAAKAGGAKKDAAKAGDEPLIQGADWHLEDTLTVKGEPKGLVRVHRGRDTYSGGAHGNQDEVVQTFVEATAKRLTLADLLTTEGAKKLRARLIELAKTDAKLKEAVDEPDKVEPSDDFIVTDAGIDFLYDPYDIAAYAAGPQQISVAWTDLSASLKDDAPWRPAAVAAPPPPLKPADTKEKP